ncbi:MAG: tetratricopeptide repeat protein [Planctomyces sp.]|nr:tetratricopeptide repeat protein [Planctomyces sp.]
MSKAPIQPRVQSGVPWWLWAIMFVLGAGVLLAVINSLVPPDGDKFVTDANTAYKAMNQLEMEKAVNQLKKIPSKAAETKLLEGMLILLKNRPKLAVPILEEASKEASVRSKALSYLAQAHAKSGNRMKCVEVLREAVREDESNTYAVSLLGNQLFEMGALNESLSYLNVLIEKKTPEASTSSGLIGNILFDLDRYEEAVPYFINAIEGNPGDPTTGMSTLKLVQCYIKLGDFEKALKYVESAEDVPAKEAARAEALLATGDEKGAMQITEKAKMSMGIDVQVQKILARLALKNGKGKCEEVYPGLKDILATYTRDAEYYQLLTEIAKTLGKDDEAALFEQNATQLFDLKKQYTEKRLTVLDGLSDIEGRIAVGDLAAEAGLYEQARFWYGTAARIDSKTYGSPVTAKINALYTPKPELVSTAAFRSQTPSTPATEGGIPGDPASQQ